jgi:mannosyltransferase OCH1-like enzyme
MYEKIVHQIWLQGIDNVPTKFNKNIKSIKDYNPNYKYIFWDEISIINLMKQNNDYLKTYYKFIFMHQKIDFAKYVILYLFGGIYIDIDVECIKPLDQLTGKYPNYDTIMSHTSAYALESYIVCGSSSCYNNGIFITIKGSEVMKVLIDTVIENPDCTYYPTKHILQFSCVNDTTGPNFISKALKSHDFKGKLLVLKNEYLEPCRDSICEITDNTYLVHRHELSWIEKDSNGLIGYYNLILFITVVWIIWEVLYC